jgi:hypothetical protein
MGKVPHVVYTLCLLPTDSEWEIRHAGEMTVSV